MKKSDMNISAAENGYHRAIELLRKCATDDGFLASPTKKANYRRIWGRDGVIIGLAALMSEEEDLIAAMRSTLITLADHQGPHGEIPSNVDTSSGRVSYGGMAGRVDACLWFLIGCGEYFAATRDNGFREQIMPSVHRVLFLLGAWEFNNRGLLYVPETGDWADEYIHSGYVLFDQLLHYQALKTVLAMDDTMGREKRNELFSKSAHLRKIIRANYWLDGQDSDDEDIYHEILFQKGQKAATRCASHYWLPFFTPHGYGYRFDSFSNILASLFGIADSTRRRRVENYIRHTIMADKEQLLPAFSPVIKPVDRDWDDLKMTFSYTFKNAPHEYHNGGLWPMISGFYVAELMKNGEPDKARNHLLTIHEANSLVMENEPWGFPEYLHGRKFTPGGTRHQGWSAAGAVIGTCSLNGKSLFVNGGE